ncbi:MAG: hypothetical protein AB2A00_12810 [Myxococcota bacterium]
MGKKKPDNTVMADQLKAVAQKMAQDKAAAEQAERQAKARAEEMAAQKRAQAEGNLDDDERFLKAVSGMSPRDRVRKFEDAPPKGPKPPPPAEEDVFLQAMKGVEQMPKGKK